jgi:alpha-ketoglutaric semialdehyde dehydrogenase
VSLHGLQLIGDARVRASGDLWHGCIAASGEPLEPGYADATLDEIDRALTLANRAHRLATPPQQRAALLEAIARALLELGPTLLDRCALETGLPLARLESERARTCKQLDMFAALVREGSWVDARIDRAQPERKPLPRPDLRRMLVPVGPVVVFAASNFPLAFSVAGGDAASALAAGCPVVVKAHPSHPGTSEHVGEAMLTAGRSVGMPEGWFSLVHGRSHAIGRALVMHPTRSSARSIRCSCCPRRSSGEPRRSPTRLQPRSRRASASSAPSPGCWSCSVASQPSASPRG